METKGDPRTQLLAFQCLKVRDMRKNQQRKPIKSSSSGRKKNRFCCLGSPVKRMFQPGGCS